MLLLHAIYGCIELAIQWYKLCSETLNEKGFKLNPYDRCVANKMVNCKNEPLCGMWKITKCNIWNQN